MDTVFIQYVYTYISLIENEHYKAFIMFMVLIYYNALNNLTVVIGWLLLEYLNLGYIEALLISVK